MDFCLNHKEINMKPLEAKYKALPFWSWNDDLDPETLKKQIAWMNDNGIGGFFMHARGGLKTPYLGQKWFECVDACVDEANKLGMEAYAYDENGWPSGFAGGELLNDEGNCDRYLEYSFGPYDENALVSYDYKGSSLVRVSSGEDVMNVYKKISNSTVDICNKDVVRKFINLTHEQYKSNDKGGLKGFFTDEPQYYRWAHPYTECLPSYFKEHYDQDILDGLGLMFVEKEGYREFRYRYWLAMQDLMLNAFGRQIYEWCDDNGYRLTGHYVEETSLSGQMWCCAGIMPFYEFEHIPGVDWLGRGCPDVMSPKQTGSVASQLGKEQVLTEVFSCSGWDVSPIELKRNGQALYWGGVNLICHHLLPYAEHGQRKRDYPAHYTPLNGWVKKRFGEFNDYFSYLGRFLAQSEENPQIAVIQPVRSVYFDYKRMIQDDYLGTKDIALPLAQTIEKLAAMHVNWHFLDETLLQRHGFAGNGKIGCGKKSYSILVLPKMLTLGKKTAEFIDEFVSSGGKLCLPFGVPAYLEGQPHDFSHWKEDVALDDLASIDGFASNESYDYRISRRSDAQGKEYLFIVNTSDKEVDVSLAKQGAHSCLFYDVTKDTFTPSSLNFKLEKGGARIAYFSEKEALPKKALEPISLPKSFHIAKPLNNFLTLDDLSYSLDGETYSNAMFHMIAFSELLQKRYKGRLFLKYAFEVESLPPSCELEIENERLYSVKLNGVELKKIGASAYEKDLLVYDASPAMKVGHNEVIVEMDYWQDEKVYFALFGENVQESLRNCLVYDSNIEPIYLKGEFGVYGSFHEGQDVLLGENFRIGKQKRDVTCLIEEGYPFFHGDVELEGTLHVDNNEKELVIDETFSLIELYVNSKKVEASMFDYRFDLSEYLHAGDNDIKVVLTVSPRNCMGPHHTGDADAKFVGPFTFESSTDCNVYSFVKTII